MSNTNAENDIQLQTLEHDRKNLAAINRALESGKIDEASDPCVVAVRDGSLSEIYPELSCQRTVDPAVRSPGVGAGEGAAEISITHSFGEGDEYRHKFRRTTGHHCIYRDKARGHLAVRWRN